MKLPSSIRIIDLAPDYPVLQISHPLCSGTVALHGAHVMAWRPNDEEEVLYLSPQAVYTGGVPIRGGIPICWPWFNAHPNNKELPSHGLVRNVFWQLKGASESKDGVTIKLSFRKDNWQAALTIDMGKELVVSLQSYNPSNEKIKISGALHTYLNVGNIGQIRIRGLEASNYLDTVGPPIVRKQEGSIMFQNEVDRIYESSGITYLDDPVLKRTIVVEKSGSPSTVIWNPWKDKAAALKDLPDDAYLRFACIETSISNQSAISLNPADCHEISTKIRVVH
ncbi:D-hexose-6-phosphate mutarotase [Luteolibacter algae]|uniref:Putative glucose-6-phosphate 1-epimerase n=1 Tax=Luteolibacter algae TaxID=454151 RepID=A0ABW5D6I7_9BACT